jgi:hypothetical protein
MNEALSPALSSSFTAFTNFAARDKPSFSLRV